MKPLNSPTQGEPNLRKIGLKSGIWATFPIANTVVFRGLGLVLYRKKTPRNLTQANYPQTPWCRLVSTMWCGILIGLGRASIEWFMCPAVVSGRQQRVRLRVRSSFDKAVDGAHTSSSIHHFISFCELAVRSALRVTWYGLDLRSRVVF